MFLFKASGATYQSVVDRGIHAFPGHPKGVAGGELVLLSKNRGDCAIDEPQIQFVAKLLRVRRAYPQELDALFPGVSAGERWKWIAELYWVRALTTPFDLSSVKGLDWKRYKTVQGYARFDEADSNALIDHLARANAAVLLDILNNAEPPDDADKSRIAEAALGGAGISPVRLAPPQAVRSQASPKAPLSDICSSLCSPSPRWPRSSGRSLLRSSSVPARCSATISPPRPSVRCHR